MLQIGPFEDASRVIVAPMAGVTDQPFRNLCRKFGARWVVSEMVTSDRKLWHTPKSRQRLRFHNEPEPRWVQIAGADPLAMASAAQANVELGAQIIDINMGCPAKKVCNKAAGSALLRNESLVASILHSVVSATSAPVTLKIRLGWSPQEKNAVRIAHIAEDCGIQLLTVHGRTRQCKFQGDVDYRSIAEVKASVRIPVIANGDIKTAADAQAVLAMTQADGVMIGRAAQGRPWLPGEIDAALAGIAPVNRFDSSMLSEILCEHIEQLAGFYGEYTGVRVARKHVGWTLDTVDTSVFPYPSRVKQAFNKLTCVEDQLSLIQSVFSERQIVA